MALVGDLSNYYLAHIVTGEGTERKPQRTCHRIWPRHHEGGSAVHVVLWEGPLRSRWRPGLHDVGPGWGLVRVGGQVVLRGPDVALLAHMARYPSSAHRALVLRQELTGGAALLILRGTCDGGWKDTEKKTRLSQAAEERQSFPFNCNKSPDKQWNTVFYLCSLKARQSTGFLL